MKKRVISIRLIYSHPFNFCMMKTNDEIHVSKSLEEVWEWKEKAYETTKHLTFEQLQAHYKKNREKLAALLGTEVFQLENGAYIFNK